MKKIQKLFAFASLFGLGFTANPILVDSINRKVNHIQRTTTNSRVSSLTESEFSNLQLTGQLADTNIINKIGNTKFHRYEVFSTRKLQESVYSGISVHYESGMGEVEVSISSISNLSYTYRSGYGVSSKTGAMGLTGELELEMASSTTETDTLSAGLSLKLSPSNSTGTYYLYYNVYFADSITVKTNYTDGSFIEGERVTSSSSNMSGFSLSLVKPAEFMPVAPVC